jgi:dienelactone hydrolase
LREPEAEISASLAAGGALRLGFLQADGDDLYWQEGRPDGTTALVRRRVDGAVEDVAPSVRSRVYEYGGRAYCVRQGRLCIEEDGPTGDHFMAEDGAVVFVRERGEIAEIVRSNPPKLAHTGSSGGFGEVVATGRDFYAAPRERDGQLAYLCWDHPDMPWDGAELWVDDRHVAGGDGVSCLQPSWLADGSLAWIDDRTGWWNLYRDDRPVHPLDAEVGYPAWQLGFQNFCELQDGRIAFTARSNGFEQLLIDGRPVELPFTELQFLVPFRDGLACLAGGPRHDLSIVAIDPSGAFEVLRPGLEITLDEVSVPEHVSFATAHALFYAPVPAVACPPVIVLSHGGPTSQASSALDLGVQFWTSRGFAVADVDYRGSTGYGRSFREALHGQWGVADVEDCVACVEHLAAEGRVDGDRAIIRGSSAGGYTTLQALTTTDAFAVGSSRYGLGDLDIPTHRFEAGYTAWLVGDAARERSPIHHLDGLSAPVILFQGLDDKVVLPDQARAMAAALEAKGLDHELHLFEGEGHGFRRAETRAAVLEAELPFFRRAIGSPAS